MVKRRKLKKIILLVCLLLIVVIGSVYLLDFSKFQVSWGVTFSREYTQNELGLDWQETYLAILDDLKIDHLRLSAYWDYIENEKDRYDFADFDWQVAEASRRDVKLILAVGRRLPRWPECHDPAWLSSATTEEVEAKQLAFIEEVVKRYDSNQNVIYWQVENEPYLKFFGKCPPLDKEFLKKEIQLVKSLSDKPILITDSGELSFWLSAGESGADILGTTLYRVVYNERFGYLNYFFPPVFYTAKVWLLKALTPIEKVIVTELQAEAWHTEDKDLREMTNAEAFESLDLKQFRSNIKFARRAGFTEVYLWGVEWWYFLKTQRGDDSFWQEAKKLWQ